MFSALLHVIRLAVSSACGVCIDCIKCVSVWWRLWYYETYPRTASRSADLSRSSDGSSAEHGNKSASVYLSELG